VKPTIAIRFYITDTAAATSTAFPSQIRHPRDFTTVFGCLVLVLVRRFFCDLRLIFVEKDDMIVFGNFLFFMIVGSNGKKRRGLFLVLPFLGEDFLARSSCGSYYLLLVKGTKDEERQYL
jgi:hypothetical protein